MKETEIDIKKVCVSQSVYIENVRIGDERKVVYEIKLDDGSIRNTIQLNRDKLIEFRNRIEEVLRDVKTTDLLNVSESVAKEIEQHCENDAICKMCDYRFKPHCVYCVDILKVEYMRELYAQLLREECEFEMNKVIYKNKKRLVRPFSVNERDLDNEVFCKADLVLVNFDELTCVFIDDVNETVSEDVDSILKNEGIKVKHYTSEMLKRDIKGAVDDMIV